MKKYRYKGAAMSIGEIIYRDCGARNDCISCPLGGVKPSGLAGVGFANCREYAVAHEDEVAKMFGLEEVNDEEFFSKESKAKDKPIEDWTLREVITNCAKQKCEACPFYAGVKATDNFNVSCQIVEPARKSHFYWPAHWSFEKYKPVHFSREAVEAATGLP